MQLVNISFETAQVSIYNLTLNFSMSSDPHLFILPQISVNRVYLPRFDVFSMSSYNANFDACRSCFMFLLRLIIPEFDTKHKHLRLYVDDVLLQNSLANSKNFPTFGIAVGSFTVEGDKYTYFILPSINLNDFIAKVVSIISKCKRHGSNCFSIGL